ncbi:MAG TPA: Rieske (2Fe-2S) protein [Myxococcales bacterium]|jgi:nitrite reductase/ring-hydroxylating ferredoxin subunit|nr:Rieske (2Fe-2S) protein [Myxococcales bacterium]HIL00995.1 Rieske (2Fe-2S) protein [Myxococcales bacterium]
METDQERRVCRLDEIPDGDARGFSLPEKGGRPLGLIVVRIGSGVRVYENRCPHRGTPLDWAPDRFLDETGKYLVCSTHAALFRLEDGECVSGPCPGESLGIRPARVRDGVVVLLPPRAVLDRSNRLS